MRYTFKQYLAYMAIITKKVGDDYRNYIQEQLDSHPELADKKQSWEAWKEEPL